jgi:hypothetical protein
MFQASAEGRILAISFLLGVSAGSMTQPPYLVALIRHFCSVSPKAVW